VWQCPCSGLSTASTCRCLASSSSSWEVPSQQNRRQHPRRRQHLRPSCGCCLRFPLKPTSACPSEGSSQLALLRARSQAWARVLSMLMATVGNVGLVAIALRMIASIVCQITTGLGNSKPLWLHGWWGLLRIHCQGKPNNHIIPNIMPRVFVPMLAP